MVRRRDDGAPEPLGLTLDARGANVAVYSAHATAIELCLFDDRGETEIERLRLPAHTGDVFHGYFEGIVAGQRYGLRAYGPFDPAAGHRFNPAKLLIEPYAQALDQPFALAPAMFGGDTQPDATDSAPFMPKAVALPPIPSNPPSRPSKSCADLIIYEMHVRGFTKMLRAVPESLRGTFGGLAHPAAIARLQRLGATAVELMPCAAWVDERHLRALGLTNYWGYNPVALMAPDPRLAPGGWAEIRASVEALHAAGIEVIIDIVLNHTGEGDAFGPTLSLRGLDNATYYRHTRDTPRTLVNDTGCGNTLALDRPAVVRLAMDTLRTWAQLGGVDGFRFDLATTLGRRDDGFDPAAPLLTAIAQDPLLRELRMIAEPWDIGPGGYRMSAFPAGWGEWNDQFRDTMRKFWHGDGGLTGAVATRFSGSSDVFAPHYRLPSDNVNFIVAHDGFTLADLVSYEHKHNDANGEGGRDGTDANYSWNNGAEGPTDDAGILAERRREQRNLLATLLLARGTPMLAMGAEFGHSQHGNNNAYAQDNPTSWLDWDRADANLPAFTTRLVVLRKAHSALTRDAFLTGAPVDASLVPDVEWLTAGGTAMQPSDWSDPQGRTLIAALYAPAFSDSEADRVVVVLHAGREPINIVLPEARDGFGWRRCIDTAYELGEPAEDVQLGSNTTARIERRTVVLFTEVADAAWRHARPSAGTAPALLERLARAAGIAPDWHDIHGTRHVVPDATKQLLLEDMGFAAASNSQLRESLGRLAEEMERRPLPWTCTVHEGAPITLRMAVAGGRWQQALLIQREDGGEVPVRLAPGDLEFATVTGADGCRVDTTLVKLPPLPMGRHRIILEATPETSCSLTVAPHRCFLPPELSSGKRSMGLVAQLYSLRREGDQGIGDLTTLAQLAEMAGEKGAATLGLNPLHALFPGERERASPYYPSDRRFIDPIYIDVAALSVMASADGVRAAIAEHADRFAELSLTPHVDYPGVWATKRALLEAAFADFETYCANAPDSALPREFSAFVTAGGTALQQFACFQALSESRGNEAWSAWPAELARCEPDALAAFAVANSARVRFHYYLQWIADRQLGEAAARGQAAGLRLGLYRDLAVGAAPDGAEAWSNASQLLQRFSVGAPPDPFAEGGQNWGLQPPDPLAWRRSGFGFLNELLAANMCHAGALRIDHAMALSRLFVIPQGAAASDGAYLSYPADELIAHLALQSTRARCLVVGEDLGTVPSGFREQMDAANILSYRVLWFERDAHGFKAPEAYPVRSVACLSTHDLPPLAGWWQAEDIREKEALGLLSPHQAAVAHQQRTADKRAFLELIGRGELADTVEPLDPAIIAAAHDFLARTSSQIALIQVDDLLGEAKSVNLPGTDQERPNWRRKLAGNLADLRSRLPKLVP